MNVSLPPPLLSTAGAPGSGGKGDVLQGEQRDRAEPEAQTEETCTCVGTVANNTKNEVKRQGMR